MENSPNTQSAGIRVRVSDLLFAIQKRWTIIVALALIGLVFGVILSAMTYVRSSFQSYEVRGSFAVTTMNENGLYINNASAPNNNDYHLAEDMMDAVKYIIRSDRVLGDVINKLELLGYTAKDLRNAITVNQYNTTQVMEMSFIWRNAEESVAVWKEIVDTASKLLPETLQLGSLAVINEPTSELIGVAGSGTNMTVLLTILGFAAGLGYAVIELLMHPTLNNVRDVETLFGLETIGVIPRDNSYNKRKGSLLVQGEGGSSLTSQNYSAAAYILRNRLGTREKNHCFYVTSAIDGEGKSAVAANLAIQLSDMEHRTLLIDFDTRNPSLGSLFLDHVDYAHSLNALYSGEATEEEAITTLTGYLDILPAVLEHNVMVMDGQIVDLFQKLCGKYEYVILDAPPVGQFSDALSLNQIASTVLFVIGYDKSSIPEIQNALEKLDKSGIRVLGCVVNGVQSARSGGREPNREQRRKQNKSESISHGEDQLMESVSENAETEEGKALAVLTNVPILRRKKQTEKKSRKGKESPEAEKTGKETAAQAVPEKTSGETGGGGSAPLHRNLMEELMQKEEAADKRSDQDTYAELLKMGMEPEKKEKEPAPEQKEQPADGKKDKAAEQKEKPADGKKNKAPEQKEQPADGKKDKAPELKEKPAEGKKDKDPEKKEEPADGEKDKDPEKKEEPAEGKKEKAPEQKEKPADGKKDKAPEGEEKAAKTKETESGSEEKSGEKKGKKKSKEEKEAARKKDWLYEQLGIRQQGAWASEHKNHPEKDGDASEKKKKRMKK